MKRRSFLRAEWRHLAMLNFAIDPTALRPLVTRGTELDAFDGRTLVSVVGFQFLGTRVWGVPVPLHTDFEEVNLRFYVRRREGGEWRRGVVFVREIVPRLGIAVLARWLYGEPYVALPMRSTVERTSTGIRVEYGWRSAHGWNGLEAAGEGEPREIGEGSEEEFITEHYWGYTARGSTTAEYEVEHPRWRVWAAKSSRFECDVAGLYGETFVEALNANPVSAFIAEGSPIVVHAGAGLTITEACAAALPQAQVAR